MLVPSIDDWDWEVLHIDKKNHYVLQRARGAEGDIGIIGIPNIELCTFTFLRKGLLEIRDYDTPLSEEGLGVMGEGVKFHYKWLRHGYSLFDPNITGRVDYFGKELPSIQDIYKTASKTHVKLKTVSDVSEFFCVSDPYDKIVWGGNLFYINANDEQTKRLNIDNKSEYVFEPEKDGSKIVPFSEGININGKEMRPYELHELAKYDKAFTVTGPKGSLFAKLSHAGVYNKNEDLSPRYVQQHS